MRRVSLIRLAVVHGVIAACASADRPVAPRIEAMSTSEKLMRIHVVDDSASMAERMTWIAEGIGGFLLSAPRDFVYPEELAEVCRGLQRAAADSGTALLIGLRQEGGVFAPLHPMFGAAATPGPLALGAGGDAHDARIAYGVTGRMLDAHGVNFDLAPAIDPPPQGASYDVVLRSFGYAINDARPLIDAAVRGLEEGGVIACPIRLDGTATLRNRIAIPEAWRTAIAAGAKMVAVSTPIPGVSANEDAYALRWQCRVLRDELGFDGVIVCDASVAKLADHPDAVGGHVSAALTAGCDLVLVSGVTAESLRAHIEFLAAAMKEGVIPSSALEDAVRRSWRLRPEFAGAPAGAFSPNAAASAAMRRMATEAVTVAHDPHGLAPVAQAEQRIVVVCPPAFPRAPEAAAAVPPAGRSLAWYVRRHAPGAMEVYADPDVDYAQARRVAEVTADADLIIIGAWPQRYAPRYAVLVDALLRLRRPTILVGYGTVADLAAFPEAPAAVAIHGAAAINFEAAAAVLFGER